MSPENEKIRKEAKQLADFIMFTQRSILLGLSKKLNGGNISYSQFFLLGHLDKEEHLTMGSIAEKVGHSTAAATCLVDRLEKLGYVQRMRVSDDRRKVMVQITRKGICFVNEMRDEILENLVELMTENNEESIPVLEN